VTSLHSGAVWTFLFKPTGTSECLDGRSSAMETTCHLLCWLPVGEIAAGHVPLLRSRIAYVYVGNVNINTLLFGFKKGNC
jgi:hypothetical protein